MSTKRESVERAASWVRQRGPSSFRCSLACARGGGLGRGCRGRHQSRTTHVLALLALSMCAVVHAQEIPKLPPPGLEAPPADLPRVRLVSLGGTISGTATERLNITNYGAPRLSPQQWVDALPELALVAKLSVEDWREPEGQASRPVSLHWMNVARRLQQMALDPSIDGIVITHGTNVMAEVAYFMNLVVDIKKPVVFVGAQRPWTGMSGDGPLNLYNAVRVAASKDAAGKGVLQAMNQNVHAARDVTKTSAYRMNTFQAVDLGVLGVADPDLVKFFTEPTRRHTYKSEFKVASLPSTLPLVEVVYSYSDAPGYLIDAMVQNGVKGIVIDGTGAGAITPALSEAAKRAQDKGVVVVATARTHGGRVQDTPRRREANIIPGDNLLPEKAKLLLQLALTKTSELKEITRVFNEY
jgi:L-asparaginase